MKLKGLSRRERSEQLRKWKDNIKVTCAVCSETVRAKDAAHDCPHCPTLAKLHLPYLFA